MLTEENKKCVALIELGDSHDECLFSQYYFLKEADYKIHLIINEIPYQRIKHVVLADSVLVIPDRLTRLEMWNQLFHIKHHLRINKIKILIFNTSQGNILRNLTLLLNRKYHCCGVMHNANKLKKSFTQKIISRKIKNYLVLNDTILDELKKLDLGFSLQSFYPVFFPSVNLNKHPDRETKSFNVCIPGKVELKRKDYFGLVNKLTPENLSPGIKFIILGNALTDDGKLLKAEIEKKRLEPYFEFYNEFITNDVFFDVIRSSNLIMPLIHPSSSGYEQYNKYKISGTYNLAFGFKIPLFVPEEFRSLEDFREGSFFYTPHTIPDTLNNLAENPDLLTGKKQQLEQSEKFNFRFQQKKYIDFIESHS